MGDAGAVGHAEHVPLTRPGNHPAHGASRTPPLTGGCETNVAAYNAADAITSRLTNGARAAPAGLHTLGGGHEAGAPWVAWVQSVTPDGCG